MDFLRIFAMLLVIFNHTPAYSMLVKWNCSANVSDILSQCLSVGCRMAVPLFLMMSGALLLPRDEPVKHLVYKRIWRFTQALLLFMIIQYTYYSLVVDGELNTIKNFVVDLWHCNLGKTGVLMQSGAGCVWYFGIHLGLLLFLPILRGVKRLDTSTLIYLFVAYIVLSMLLPALYTYGTGLPSKGFAVIQRFPLDNYFIYYVLVGYFIEHRINIDRLKTWHWGMLFIGTLVSFAVTLWHYNGKGGNINIDLATFSVFMIIPTVALYLSTKKMCRGITAWGSCANILSKLGAAVFTVMFFEGIIRKLIRLWMPQFPYYTEYWASIVVSIVTLIVGLAIGLVFKRIPYIKKIV